MVDSIPLLLAAYNFFKIHLQLILSATVLYNVYLTSQLLVLILLAFAIIAVIREPNENERSLLPHFMLILITTTNLVFWIKLPEVHMLWTCVLLTYIYNVFLEITSYAAFLLTTLWEVSTTASSVYYSVLNAVKDTASLETIIKLIIEYDQMMLDVNSGLHQATVDKFLCYMYDIHGNLRELVGSGWSFYMNFCNMATHIIVQCTWISLSIVARLHHAALYFSAAFAYFIAIIVYLISKWALFAITYFAVLVAKLSSGLALLQVLSILALPCTLFLSLIIMIGIRCAVPRIVVDTLISYSTGIAILQAFLLVAILLAMLI